MVTHRDGGNLCNLASLLTARFFSDILKHGGDVLKFAGMMTF